ncbi:sulfatase-like hydrolase/transferase [Salinigranum salinum]|uniref:sulfatase-like hydrolase/transferase n=1 Tax=Salinigranum salinum TaxID=1364937 RepID=UPI001260A987|nr:sulfatase-like hydrolase/transferase [Salinigranum salinum]
MGDRPDVVLLTVDCWRHDAIERMDRFRSLTSEYVRSEAVCQSAATPGVFPSILASLYYPQAYTASGALRSSVRTLPAVLADHGYRTGAIVADNPFLDRFAGEFDFFWNGGAAETKLERLFRLARQRDTVPVTEVADRAHEWFDATDGPRFLLAHLMDPHEPYLPGFRRGLGEGVVDSYRTIWKFARDRQSLSPAERETVENLYWRCVDYLDDHVEDLFSLVPDDAIVILVGDHGEEFAHGAYRHARLYDECVRVPLLTKNLSRDRVRDGDAAVRQLDLAPTVLEELGIAIPERWEGRPANGDPRPSFMLNHSPHLGKSYVGRRTETAKLVKTYDRVDAEPTRTEFFDLRADPAEEENRYAAQSQSGDERLERLERDLAEFLDRPEIREGIRRGTEPDVDDATLADDAVAERLKALGYR